MRAVPPRGHHGDGDRGDGRRAGARLAKKAEHGHGLPSRRLLRARRSGVSSMLRFTSPWSFWYARDFADAPLACGNFSEAMPVAAGGQAGSSFEADRSDARIPSGLATEL